MSFDDDGAPLYTCITPTPAPPIEPGVVLERGWAAYEVESAMCNNGDLARFWFRPAHDSEGALVDSDDWLIFLKGGGSCFDAPSCGARWLTHAYYVAPPMAPRWVPQDHGIFRTADNAFSRVHQVYVHYCSSDSFRGTGYRSPSTGFHHDGHLIVEQVLDALEAGLELRPTASDEPTTYRLTSDSQVLIAGGSADATGAAQHLDWVAERLDARVLGLIDSLWTMDILPLHFQPVSPDYPVFTDETCAAAAADPINECTNLFALAPYLETPFFAYTAAQDGLTYPYGGLCVRADPEAACVAPNVYIDGRCYEPTTVVPEVVPCDHGEALNAVDPHGLACWDDLGAGERGYVAREDAYHVNVCESELTMEGISDASGDCGEGYTCWSGHCVREDFSYRCRSSAECPGGDDVCLGTHCVHPADTSGPTATCDDDAYTLDEDTLQCRLPFGCVTEADCEDGELCLDAWSAPYSGSRRMGVRQSFARSDIAAYFVVDGRRRHTIMYTEDNAFFQAFPSMRSPGAATAGPASLHDTLLEWVLHGASPATRLMQDPP